MRASEGGVMSKIGHLTDSLWCELRTKDPAMGGGLVQKSENTVSQIQKLPFIREKVHKKTVLRPLEQTELTMESEKISGVFVLFSQQS